MASINYNMHLEYGLGNDDDIDHLGNRRIRAVGELLQEPVQNRSVPEWKGVVRERMTSSGSGRNFTTVPDQHKASNCSGKRILRIFSAVTVHGSEQPAW